MSIKINGLVIWVACCVAACGGGGAPTYDSTAPSGEIIGPLIPPVRDALGDIVIPSTEFTASPIFDDWFYEVDGHNNNFNFYLYLPESYKAKPEATYPLLIVLHGDNGYAETRPKLTPYPLPSGVFNGFVGADKTTLLASGRDTLNKHVKDAFVIHPEIPHVDRTDRYIEPLGYWNPNSLNRIVDYLSKDYRIDESRIYVVGASMGGGGTFHYAQTNSKKIAAILPICNGLAEYETRADRMRDMPVWMFHNYDDSAVKFNESILPVVNHFMKTNIWATFPSKISPVNEYTISYDPVTGAHPWVMGSNYVDGLFNFTLYPTGGHNAWDKTYAKDEVWDWLFSQTNKRE